MLHNLCHGHNGRGLKTVLFADLSQCTLLSLAPLHTVHGNHKAQYLHISLSLHDGEGFLNRGTCRCHILDDYNPVAIPDGTSEQDTLIAVILDLLAVAAVADVLAKLITDGDGGGYAQRNPLVGRAEEDIKVKAELIVNGLGIVASQLP